VLFGIPMQIGSILADKDEYTQNQFFELGKTMALAFQIQDDILDLTIGKGHEIGSDIKKGKRTLIFIKTYEKNKEIKKYLGKDDIKPAIKIINDSGAIQYSKKIAMIQINNSKSILKSLNLEMKYENLFSDLIRFMIERSY
jgi:geranylgeranyl pyrophosphate synthase